jgi:hypothetical protein
MNVVLRGEGDPNKMKMRKVKKVNKFQKGSYFCFLMFYCLLFIMSFRYLPYPS